MVDMSVSVEMATSHHSAAAATCYGEQPSEFLPKSDLAAFFSDVNECAYSNGGCQHKCINSGDSYHCECNSGYVLQI